MPDIVGTDLANKKPALVAGGSNVHVVFEENGGKKIKNIFYVRVGF